MPFYEPIKRCGVNDNVLKSADGEALDDVDDADAPRFAALDGGTCVASAQGPTHGANLVAAALSANSLQPKTSHPWRACCPWPP